MWNEPSDADLNRIPGLYETEQSDLAEKVIHMHFFYGGCDWYAAEYGKDDRLFFGYAILNSDLPNAEWGYFSYDELRAIKVHGFEVDRDLHWMPRVAGEVDKIRAAYTAQGKALES